jgi:hypothetical protein
LHVKIRGKLTPFVKQKQFFSAKRTHYLFTNFLLQATPQVKQWIGPEMFIVKMLMISYTENHPIYIKWKEGARRLAVRETERECV